MIITNTTANNVELSTVELQVRLHRNIGGTGNHTSLPHVAFGVHRNHTQRVQYDNKIVGIPSKNIEISPLYGEVFISDVNSLSILPRARLRILKDVVDSTCSASISHIPHRRLLSARTDMANRKENFCKWSEEFQRSSWIKYNVTVGVNESPDPHGAENSSDMIYETADNGIHGIRYTYSGSLGYEYYKVSIFARMLGRTKIKMDAPELDEHGDKISDNYVI